MIGFTKEQIIEKAQEWMDKNQAWADQVTREAASRQSNPLLQLQEGMLANLRIVLPKAIAEIMEKQNKVMEKQIEDMIIRKATDIFYTFHD